MGCGTRLLNQLHHSRKDGTPFINLIMCVPLRDQSGRVRYYLGAQLDITDLVNDSTGLPSLKRLMQRHDSHRNLVKNSDNPVETIQKDELEQLGETFNPNELEKLIKLRQRQQLETEETSTKKDSVERREEHEPVRPPLADLDQGFQFNGEGSAPPLGYYKTVSLILQTLVKFQIDLFSTFSSVLLLLFGYCLHLPTCECLEFFNHPF